MNDSELKNALVRMTEGCSPDRAAEKVRERIREERRAATAYGETKRGTPGSAANGIRRARWPVVLAAALIALTVVMTAAVAAAPMLRNYLNTLSLQEDSIRPLTEVPDGWTGVYTLDGLDAVREDLTGYYILMEDLSFAEADFADGGRFPGGWTPIGTKDEPFRGIFNGNGHTIDGLTISVAPIQDGAVHAGLFGVAASDSSYVTETSEPVYEEEVEMDVNGDGIPDKVTVASEPRHTLIRFGDWGLSGTIRNLRLTNGSLRMVYPAQICELAETSNENLYVGISAYAGPVAGYADYVLGCSVENFTVTLEPAGDAKIIENAVPVPVEKRVLALAAGGVAGQSYLIDSCCSSARLSVTLPANASPDCFVNAGGLCGIATACVTSYFDGSVDCGGITPGLCLIRTDDVPRFLPAAVMDEIVTRLLFTEGYDTGVGYFRPDDYDELTEAARKWGVTAENVLDYAELLRVSGDRNHGFRAAKFISFYRSDDPEYSEISPDAVQDHYTHAADLEGGRNYILDPDTKPREYRELSNLISAAFPDGDFEDFCRENGVKYGMYYVYDLRDGTDCSFEGFDFDSVWKWETDEEGGLPKLRLFG